MTFVFEFTPLVVILISLAFVFELLDASLGVGYGTTLSPILLIIGFPVSGVVPSILLAELIAGIVAIVFHTLLNNVKIGTKKVFRRKQKIRRQRIKLLKKESHSISILGEMDPPTQLADPFADDIIAVAENETASVEEELEEFEEKEEILVEDEEELTIKGDEELEEVPLESKSFLDKLRNLTTDTKVIIVLSFVGLISTIIAAMLNVFFDYNEWFNFGVKIYISLMVLSMGILVLVFRNRNMKLSLKRIISLGILAGFNKGISGGGYRPITVAGQLLSGRKSRNALASTTFSKTVVCLVGVIAYILIHVLQNIHLGLAVTWEYLELAPYLTIGTVCAAPLGALITKKVDSKYLKTAIGWGTIILGLVSIIRVSLFQAGIWDKIPSFVEVLEKVNF